MEARPGAGRLVEGLREGGMVVIQGFFYQGGSGRAGLDKGMAPGQVVQGWNVHQAIADVLKKILSVLIAAVMFQPQNNKLKKDRGKEIKVMLRRGKNVTGQDKKIRTDTRNVKEIREGRC